MDEMVYRFKLFTNNCINVLLIFYLFKGYVVSVIIKIFYLKIVYFFVSQNSIYHVMNFEKIMRKEFLDYIFLKMTTFYVQIVLSKFLKTVFIVS